MSRRAGLAFAIAVTAFAGVTTWVGSVSGAPLEFLVLDLVTGLWFVIAGVAAVWLRPGSPAGPMLIASGALWYVGSYAPTGQPVVTYLGFAFERYYDLVLGALLLILSAPAQRPQPRWLIPALSGAMALRSIGRLFLQDPVRTYGCEDCQPNVFAVLTDARTFETVEAVTSFAMAALFVVVGLVALARLVRAGPVARRARWPIIVAGTVAMGAAAFDAFEYGWTTATATALLDLAEPWDGLFEWALFMGRVLVAFGFLVAALRLRTAAGPLGPLTAGLSPAGAGAALGDSLRAALGDPSARLLRPADGGVWTDEAGATVAAPASDRGRALRLVGAMDSPVAALDHDLALLDQPDLLNAVVRVLGLALTNERLEAEVRRQLEAVQASRQRIVSATEEERRRLERDLHDGAQQRLIGISLALQQARGTADASAAPDALRSQLDAAAHETAEAIRELRELARGIHPAILEDAGLGPAVAALARRAGIPVEVQTSLDARLSRVVESTAYFTIAESLTNAQRHANATHADVRIAHAGNRLVVEVRDDGIGGAEPERGSGLKGLADRVAAVGGSLEVDSPPGAGTAIRATIPTP